jgi:hypothetical protein
MIIPASWCLIHQVRIPEGEQRGAGAAFEFEQFSPVRLEEMTCSFWQADETMSFVVAVFTEPMQLLLTAIERLGFIVECASVDLCVLADSLASSSGPKGLLFLDEHYASLSLIDSGARPNRMIRTLQVPEEHAVDHVQRHIALSVEMLDPASIDWQLVTMGNRWSADDLACMIPYGVLAADPLGVENAISHLIDGARSRNALLNVRVDNLQSSRKWRPLLKQLERCAILALILLAVLTARFGQESSRYARAAGDLQSEQVRIYQNVFPGNPTAPGSALRIQSERIKLEGLTERDGTSDSPAGIGGIEAFALLHELTDRLPKSAKVNIEEVVLEQDGVRVAGLTTSHQVAGDWVQQLNESSLLRADPPRTKLRADATVEFRVQVKRAEGDENP